MATRIRRPVNALLCMFSWKHLKTRLLQTNLCPPCVRTAKNRQWQCNVWHIVPAFSTRWQARLGGPFRLNNPLSKHAKNGSVGLWNKFGRLVCNGWHCYFRSTVRVLGRNCRPFMGGPVRKYMRETYFLFRAYGSGNHFYS